jgi:two-component system cell cycle response regulator DivK
VPRNPPNDRGHETQPNTAPAQQPGDPTLNRCDFSVLVVDDSEDTRYAYRRYFEFCGARAQTAVDGEAALEAVMIDPPDVIVLDCAMPKMTGWQVLEHLKSDPRTAAIPIVVVSGQQEQVRALIAAADAYCDKPCLPDTLVRQVRAVLGRRGR